MSGGGEKKVYTSDSDEQSSGEQLDQNLGTEQVPETAAGADVSNEVLRTQRDLLAAEVELKVETQTRTPDMDPLVQEALVETTETVESERKPLHDLPSRIGKVFENFSLEGLLELLQEIWGMFKGENQLDADVVNDKVEAAVQDLPQEKKSQSALALEENEAPDPQGNPDARFVAIQTQNNLRSPLLAQGYRSEKLQAHDSITINPGESLAQLLIRYDANRFTEENVDAKIAEMKKMGLVLPEPPDSLPAGELYFGHHIEGDVNEIYIAGYSDKTPPESPFMVSCQAFLPGYEKLETGYEQFMANLQDGDMVMGVSKGGTISQALVATQGGIPFVHISIWDADYEYTKKDGTKGKGAFVHMHNGDGIGPMKLFNNNGMKGIGAETPEEFFAHRARLGKEKGGGVPTTMAILESPFRTDAQRKRFVEHLRGQIGTKDYGDLKLAGEGARMLGVSERLVDAVDGDSEVCTSFVRNGLVECGAADINPGRVPTLVDFYMHYRVKWQGEVTYPGV